MSSYKAKGREPVPTGYSWFQTVSSSSCANSSTHKHIYLAQDNNYICSLLLPVFFATHMLYDIAV